MCARLCLATFVHVMSVRFTCVVVRYRLLTPFSFWVVFHWANNPRFNHSPVDGRLGGVLFLSMLNKAMTILIQVLVDIYIHFSWVHSSEWNFWVVAYIYFNFVRNS